MSITKKVNGTDKALFLSECASVSGRLGVPLAWLLTIIFLESGFNSRAKNQIGAIGLIQFTPQTARSLGTSPAALAEMTRIEQLFFVEKFFRFWLNLNAKKSNFWEFYMIAFLPSLNLKGFNGSTIIARVGTTIYKQNISLDGNRDGLLTVSDWKLHVIKRLEREGLSIPEVKNFTLLFLVVSVLAITHFFKLYE
jgi:hypothetical protein